MKQKKRNKFSIDEKEQIVKSILKGEASYLSMARLNDTSHRLISLWVESYKKHGRDGLSFKNAVKHSGNFKLEVLEEMYSEGLSLHQLSVKYLVSPSVLSGWKRKYESGGKRTLFMQKRRGRPSKAKKKEKTSDKAAQSTEEQLRKENELLRAENDYLKKLRALLHNQK